MYGVKISKKNIWKNDITKSTNALFNYAPVGISWNASPAQSHTPQFLGKVLLTGPH